MLCLDERGASRTRSGPSSPASSPSHHLPTSISSLAPSVSDSCTSLSLSLPLSSKVPISHPGAISSRAPDPRNRAPLTSLAIERSP